MSYTPDADYLFVIDTNSYAGNFERDMCAYITGNIGDCEVGKDMAEMFATDGYEPFDNLLPEADEDGCYRPATSYPAPNGDMNAMAISFESRPTPDQIALMKERAKMFTQLPEEDYGQVKPLGKRGPKILGFRLIKQIITRTLVEEAV